MSEEFWEFFVPMGIATLVIAVFIAGVVFIGNHAAFITGEASIEQLRSDVARVGVAASEDVVGQVTQWNQKIVSAQRWNRVPVLGLLVPDGWDRIKPIELPTDLR
jgi:hypothetical protein